MSKFTIYSPNNEALYTGTPTFTGQYMKPGQLEFREIASPMLIDLQQGCYVGYESGNSIVPVYPRTGFTYKLYSVPQVKKQARPHSYGAAFVYQNVQFYDASKELEYCPFRDLVQGDNRIHFSTQPSISTFEGCDGLARRFEACLCEQYDSEYGRQSWQVRIATEDDDGISEDLEKLMLDPREFTVSGVNILECLDKVYEIWPEVGWVYTIEYIDEQPTNTIIIGGAGLNANTGTYAYGKGRGLTSITRTVANADEMANRIYAYGDSRNMLPRWYNSLGIKDAQSVDIQNLMIPITHWGETDNKPDASKAYVENAASVAKIGLRPKTIYFDGSGEYAAIYPTIRNKTIKRVRQALGSSSAPYYPKTTVYTNENVRIDRVLSVASVFDDGMAGDNGKSASVSSSEALGTIASTGTAPAGQTTYTTIVTKTFTMTRTRGTDITVTFSGSGYVTTTDSQGAVSLNVSVQKGDGTNFTEVKRNLYEMPLNESTGRFNMPGTLVVRVNDLSVSNGDIIRVFVSVVVQNPNGVDDLAFSYSFEPTFSFSAAWNRAKTFTISLRQIGFDIEAQANLGDGKTIAMRSGKCVGRSFTIKSASYVDTTDSWELECYRSEDESLSQWFPNTDYPVRGLEHAGQSNEYPGDEFVLLDIAMPEIYIDMAEADLYDAAQDLLADASVERWQYVPEIDAKFMVENDLTIRCGEYMAILDMDFIEPADGTASYFLTSNNEYFLTVHGERIRLDDGSGSVMSALVDSVVINEGEAAIPTYKVTLRDRKKKTWTESKGAEAPSSKSVGSIKTSQGSGEAEPVTAGDSFFKLDDNNNVTLKPEFQNLWVPGWLAAGGVGEDSSGGVSYLRELLDIKHGTTSIQRADGTAVQNGDILVYDSTTDPNNPIWVAAANSGGGGDPSTYVTLSDTQTITGAKTFTQAITAPRIAGGVNTNMYIGNSNNSAYVYIQEDTYLAGADLKGATSQSNASSNNPSWYILKDGTASFSSLTVGGVQVGGGYIGTTGVQSSAQAQALTGILSINATSSSSSDSRIVWESGNNAWHFYGNIYADGWVAAGGIGSGGGGGGSSTLQGLDDVYLSSKSSEDILYYYNGYWRNTQVKTINGYSIFGSGNIPVSGGGGGGISSVSLAQGSTNGTLKLIVDGTADSDVAVKGLGDLAFLDADDLYGTFVTLSTTQSNISGEKTFTTKPVHIGSSSGLDVHEDSYIDIGGARLQYDSTAKALHITTSDSETIGLYADGFVAAGGSVASGDQIKFVSLSGNQTVAGQKTFTGTLTACGVQLATAYTYYGGVNSSSYSRLYIQNSRSNAELLLCSSGGVVYIGTYPGSNSTPSGCLFYIGDGGAAYAGSWETTSDRRLKDDITDITRKDAVDTIMALKPSVWKWNSGVMKGATCSGFIAQDVESVVPYMVKGTEDSKSLNYQMLHAFEVGAIQDHETRIKELENKVNAL